MTNGQDTNSQAEAQAGESLKDVAPNKISSLPEKDALSDSDLECGRRRRLSALLQ